METAYEVDAKNIVTLQINPVVLPKGHCVELDAISANREGITDNGNTKSEVAMLATK